MLIEKTKIDLDIAEIQQNNTRIPFFEFVKKFDNKFGDRAVKRIKGYSIKGNVVLKGC